MLRLLNINNFVLIHQLKIEFHQGLNLLTGETGSGKSIIVDALGLLLGARRGAEVIREGARSAVIEGEFELRGSDREAIEKILNEVGVEGGVDGELLIRREINASGRHRIYLNDQTVTAATLKTLQPYLLEIHGQFEQQGLVNAAEHLELLDQFGTCFSVRQQTENEFAHYKRILEEKRQLARDLSEREQQLDLLRFQLGEIVRLNPQPGEDQQLNQERKLLAGAEKRAQLSLEAYTQLYESDDSVLSTLAIVRRRIEELRSIDDQVSQTAADLGDAFVKLQDVAETMRDYGERAEYSPARLQAIDDRLAELERLKRKYNADLDRVLQMRGEMQDRLASLEDLSGREERLAAEYDAVIKRYDAAARQLSACRRAAAPNLEDQMMRELTQVAMEQARFKVGINTCEKNSDAPHNNYFTPRGIDQIEFLLSANPGEPLRPLAKVASGGELSRLMLTLRLVVPRGPHRAGADETLIFDEIDAGVGGKAAESIGRRLAKLARGQQVLCVTHQAQIARFADHHYHVAKIVSEGRTVTQVAELDGEERIRELARMIGGGAESATLEAARWLLESARGGGGGELEEKKKRRGKGMGKR